MATANLMGYDVHHPLDRNHYNESVCVHYGNNAADMIVDGSLGIEEDIPYSGSIAAELWSQEMEYILGESKRHGLDIESQQFAHLLDDADQLKNLRSQFHLLQGIYFLGNSLGLQPRNTAIYLRQELDVWAHHANQGHFAHPYGEGRNWIEADEQCAIASAPLIGAKPGEVAIMGTLTANLHLLLCAFYHPTGERNKILIEGHTFPSDYFLVQSQIKMHGFDPAQCLIVIEPNTEEDKKSACIPPDSIIDAIKEHETSISMIMMSGVHYYSGQVFDMKAITALAHQYGIIVGLDLAHAIGNIPLDLHDWQVDFAAWCNYKYLNAGPGAISGIFVNERHNNNPKLTILRGWWGHHKQTRFLMETDSETLTGAAGFQLSNPNILSLACLRSSLEIFSSTNMSQIRLKSFRLNGYLRLLLSPLEKDNIIKLITPIAIEESGAQLSIKILPKCPLTGKEIQERCIENNFFIDYRNPCVLRMAPVALYNSFTEVLMGAQILTQVIRSATRSPSERLAG